MRTCGTHAPGTSAPSYCRTPAPHGLRTTSTDHWLERAEREQEEEPDRALRIIRIEKGSTVAAIGAGSGYYTMRLARVVGPTGRVYANDIQQGMLDEIRKKLDRRRVTNVTLVLGAVDDPKLPPASIDLALLVDVYHEFSQPQVMLRRIREALKPGGRLVLLEFRKEDPTIPIRFEHKMSVAEAKLEVESEGFTLATVDQGLPWQHILVFTGRSSMSVIGFPATFPTGQARFSYAADPGEWQTDPFTAGPARTAGSGLTPCCSI